MQRVLVTGANRGIGLEITRRLVEHDGARVFATARDPVAATALQQLARACPERLTLVPLDVADDASAAALVRTVAGAVDALDLLINNAGTKPPAATETLEGLTRDTLMQAFAINAAGPLVLVQALLPLLTAAASARIVNISSQLGAIGWPGGANYAYCSSKAALNAITRRLAADLGPRGITTIALHPGWVRTDMGGPDGELSPAESARAVLAVAAGLTRAQNGAFLKWNGERHAW